MSDSTGKPSRDPSNMINDDLRKRVIDPAGRTAGDHAFYQIQIHFYIWDWCQTQKKYFFEKIEKNELRGHPRVKTNKRRASSAKFIYSITWWSQPRTITRGWYIKYVLLRGLSYFFSCSGVPSSPIFVPKKVLFLSPQK